LSSFSEYLSLLSLWFAVAVARYELHRKAEKEYWHIQSLRESGEVSRFSYHSKLDESGLAFE
jgi:hypothetical protein